MRAKPESRISVAQDRLPEVVRTPGVEPGLAGWEPAVITTRPCPLDSSQSVVYPTVALPPSIDMIYSDLRLTPELAIPLVNDARAPGS